MNIQNLVWYIKCQGDFDYSVAGLERLGLKGLCDDYNIEYNDLSEAEKREFWEELIELAEEVEFKKQFDRTYSELD